MSLCTWIIFGFFAGLIARAIYPNKQSMGFIATTALGIAGSFMGGLLASIIAGGSWRSMNASGFIGSVLGAIVLLWLGRMLKSR